VYHHHCTSVHLSRTKALVYNLDINLFMVHQLEWFQQECYYCGTQLNVPAASREKGKFLGGIL